MAVKKNDQSISHSLIPSLKEDLASHIREIIGTQKLNHREAGDLAGTTRPRISKICKGDFERISVGAMLEILVHLGAEVSIEVKSPPTKKKIKEIKSPSTKKNIKLVRPN